MANQQYPIQSNIIPDLVFEVLCDEEGVNYESLYIQKPKHFRFDITKDGKTALLNCYFPAGKVSFSIQGDNTLFDLCEKVKQYIIDKGTIAMPTDRKTLTVREVSEESFRQYIEMLESQNGIALTRQATKDTNVAASYCLTDMFNAVVYITYYNNGTFFLQGAITGFFLTVMTESVTFLSPSEDKIIADFLELTPGQATLFSEDLTSLFPHLHLIDDDVIKSLVLTSLKMANSGLELPDNGALTYGILKALEAVLYKRIRLTLPTQDSFDIFNYNIKRGATYPTMNVPAFDGEPNTKKALLDGFKFYKDYRMPSFHVDVTIATSLILDRATAISCIHKAIDVINDICKNW